MPAATAMRSTPVSSRKDETDRQHALRREVEARTFYQIHSLEVSCQGDRVRVTGRSRTYYAKQLATQAVLAEAPNARFTNDIVVTAG